MRRVQVKIPTADYWRQQVKCQEACPVHTDARGYVRAIAEGRFADAYLIARGPNPLASICGRVCGAPCEAACRRKDIDQAISIRALKRFASDWFHGRQAGGGSDDSAELIGHLTDAAAQRHCLRSEELSGLGPVLGQVRREPGQAADSSVAIIGSGPAGLATAHDLALLGCRVTVYEMEPVPAGMLAVGIPEYRLPRDLIAAEVDFIRQLGVEFICNTQVGSDISMAEIRAQHRATVIAVGLKRSRSLAIPGADANGVLGGVELLRDVALGKETDLRGHVVVIGGGNVAYDIARTVVRQTGMDISRTALRETGVTAVHLCSIESLEELPADDLEIVEGDDEGVIRHHSIGPVEILTNDQGRVRGVVFQRCLRVFDESGHFSPQFDAEQRTTIDADTVVWGIGQQPDLSFLDAEADISRTSRGGIESDPDTRRTSADDVFVAGDIAYGPRLLIDAVASGKQVARAIYEHLHGVRLVEQVAMAHTELPNYQRMKDYEKLPRTPIPALAPEERLGDQRAIVELGYNENEAACEGCRCLDCGVNTIFHSGKCILCGGCADVCPELCLEIVSLERLAGGQSLTDSFAARYPGEDPAGFSTIIKDETKCIRCGLCAQRCPVGAITMERASFASRWLPA